MTRISATKLVQMVDHPNIGSQVVIIDQAAGDEVVLTRRDAARLAYVLIEVFDLTPEGPQPGPVLLGTPE